MLLSKQIDVIRIFHLIKYVNNLLARKSHSQTESSTAPCLAHGVEHNHVRKSVEHAAECALRREVAVGFVDDDNTLEFLQNLYDCFAVDVIARRIVRTANPDYLRLFIAGFQQFSGRNLIVFIEQYRAILYIVDVCTYFIHSVSRRNRYHIILSWAAEYTVNQIDGLVRTVAQEDFLFSYTLNLADLLLQFNLQRIRIAIVRVIIWIFVGVEEDAGISACKLRTGATVRCQIPDVFSAQIFQFFHFLSKAIKKYLYNFSFHPVISNYSLSVSSRWHELPIAHFLPWSLQHFRCYEYLLL